MGYSSVRRVGEDIYSFLDFLSPRQGPNESTNPKPPEPPPQQVASADAGALPGAGMSQPGSMSDADPGGFMPPRPDSTKPVQLAGALPSMAGGASAAMALPGGGRPVMPPINPPPPVVPEPKKPDPPKGGQAAPALTSDQGTDPGTGAPTKPLGSAFAGGGGPGGPAIPAFDPSTGKLDVMGILKQQQDAQNRMNAMSAIARGGTLMAAAASRSPSMRAVLANAAGSTPGSGGGGDGGGGAGGISAATLLELDKRSRGEAAAAYKSKIAPALAKHLGVPPEMIQFMDDDKIATLTTAIAKGENLDKETRADGSVIWTNKTTGERYAGASPDQLKVQKAADEHAQSQATTGKTTEETLKLQEEAQQRALANGNIPEISKAFGVPEVYLQNLGPEGMRAFIQDRLKKPEPTEGQKTLDGINKQRIDAGQPPISDEDWYKRSEDQKIQIARETAGFGPIATAARDEMKAARTNNEALRKGFVTRNAARGPLDRGEEGIVAGSFAADKILAMQKLLATTGWYEGKRVGNTEAYRALMADEVKNAIAGLGAGTGISDKDREFAEAAAGGQIELNQESMKRILAIRDNVARRQAEQNNESINRANEDLGRKTNDRDLLKLPPISKDELRYMDATQVREMLLNPEAGQAAFEFNYGKDGTEAAQTRIPEMIQAKMQALDDKTKTYKTFDKPLYDEMSKLTLADLTDPAARATYDQLLRDKYGDQGDGLIDLIIAAKQAHRFGAE